MLSRIGMPGPVGRQVGLVGRDRRIGTSVQIGSGAEVIDVTVGDDDHRQVDGVDSRGGDAVVDPVAAAGYAAINEDGGAG